MTRMTVESLIHFVQAYGAHGEEIAVRQRRGYRMENWSYGKIVRHANALARELERHGIGRGDAVLLWGENKTASPLPMPCRSSSRARAFACRTIFPYDQFSMRYPRRCRTAISSPCAP